MSLSMFASRNDSKGGALLSVVAPPAGLPTAGLDTAGLDTAGLDTSGLDTAGLDMRRAAAGQPSAGRLAAGGLTGRGTQPRVAAAAAVLTVAALALTGCAAGQQAQTANVYSSIDGANATIGPIGLRDVGISAPRATGYTAKANAPLTMSITNTGNQVDQLTSVTSTAATSVKVTPPTAPATASPSATAASGQATAITVPAQGLIEFGSGQGSATVTLSGLTAPLISGQVVTVTFTFRNAGTKAVMVPVRLAANDTAGETVSVGPTGD